MTSEYDPRRVEAALIARLETNMRAATVYVKGQVQRKINRGNSTGDDPSLPGEPPKKVTGRLFQSITTDVFRSSTAVIGRVGTNVEYAARLEFGFVGTDKAGRNVSQAARPYLRPALRESYTAVGKLLSRG